MVINIIMEELTIDNGYLNDIPSQNKTLTLSKRGYAIIKSDYSDKYLKRLKNKLTVKPFTIKGFGPESEPFSVYLESDKKIYMPKHFCYQELGNPTINKLSNGQSSTFNFNGSLRIHQQPVIKAFLNSCQNNNNDYLKKSQGGIISVPCGFGKTVLALYLISQLKIKTLVIVHKSFLLTQWTERINQYLPNTKIGIIQGENIEIDGCQIVIAMLQSVSMKTYPEHLFSDFGFCIVDECHHIGAQVFSRALFKINCQYMLGLSATPDRKDGLSKVFEWFIGPYIYKEVGKSESRPLRINMIYYQNYTPEYCREVNMINGKVCIPKMLNNICDYTRRNNIIIELIKQIQNEPKRCILVLSGRLNQLKYLYEGLHKIGILDVGYYKGGMKQQQLKISEKCQIILGTYSMSSEGMDIPTLNTLILASPVSDIEQSVGRILRKDHGDVLPQVYDIVDNFSVFGNQGTKRRRLYQKKNYTLYTGVFNDDLTLDIEYNIEKVLLNLTPFKKSQRGRKKKQECLITDD